MNIEQLREICLAFPGVTEDVKWDNHLCFLVGEKIFLITGLDESPIPASFKVPEEEFAEIASRDGFRQAPYFAKNQWVNTDNVENLDGVEWARYARQSYELVKSKLSKKLQAELVAMEQ